jgi:hypothetical protein
VDEFVGRLLQVFFVAVEEEEVVQIVDRCKCCLTALMHRRIRRMNARSAVETPKGIAASGGWGVPFDLLSADPPEDPCLQLLCDGVQKQHMLGRLQGRRRLSEAAASGGVGPPI